jgi:hypothetical protein
MFEAPRGLEHDAEKCDAVFGRHHALSLIWRRIQISGQFDLKSSASGARSNPVAAAASTFMQLCFLQRKNIAVPGSTLLGSSAPVACGV